MEHQVSEPEGYHLQTEVLVVMLVITVDLVVVVLGLPGEVEVVVVDTQAAVVMDFSTALIGLPVEVVVHSASPVVSHLPPRIITATVP
jgi:hypothetical protein